MTWSRDAGAAVLSRLPEDERVILVALQAIATEFGHVPSEAVPLVADELNVSVAEVHGVLTFYRDLRTEPPAAVTVQVCTAEACQANGSRQLAAALEPALARIGGRSADGRVEVREASCLGNCALGPAVSVGGRPLGRATVSAVLYAVDRASDVSDETAAAPVVTGSTDGGALSENGPAA